MEASKGKGGGSLDREGGIHNKKGGRVINQTDSISALGFIFRIGGEPKREVKHKGGP